MIRRESIVQSVLCVSQPRTHFLVSFPPAKMDSVDRSLPPPPSISNFIPSSCQFQHLPCLGEVLRFKSGVSHLPRKPCPELLPHSKNVFDFTWFPCSLCKIQGYQEICLTALKL